jgi:hypothetical protein
MPASQSPPDPLDPSVPVPPSLDAALFTYLARHRPGGYLIMRGVLAREQALTADLTSPVRAVPDP